MNFEKVHKLLGIQTMTVDEFESLMKMGKTSMKLEILKDLAKKEKRAWNEALLLNALNQMGFI